MKRLVIPAIVLLIGLYALYNYLDGRARARAKEQARKTDVAQFDRLATDAVAALVSRTNAIRHWEKTLSKGQTYRSEPVLTIELERLWLQPQPILFLGSIEDIKTLNEREYVITLSRSAYAIITYTFETELMLSLRCDKTMVDSLLTAHPKLLEDSGVNNGVAVVAKIERILTERGDKGENGPRDVKVGNGRCVDLSYTGSASLDSERLDGAAR